MKTHSTRSILAENLSATSSMLDHKKWMNGRQKMCWRCQKDKPVYGGFQDINRGVYKFICKECVDIKKQSVLAKENV